MGYPVKIQKVQRPTNRSYYVNLPVTLAEALEIQKGESFEWFLEDKNTLILQRLKRAAPRHLRKLRRQPLG
jgi:bifunctional DNA-binding transcriptional regulator/antitoxin component of YhaV-PrlF toxin-antitoxin module